MAHVAGPCASARSQQYAFEERTFDSLGELTAYLSRERARMRAELEALRQGDQELLVALLQQAYEKGYAEGLAAAGKKVDDGEYVPTAENIL